MSRKFIRSRATFPDTPIAHLEVLGYDPATQMFTVEGRFRHVWDMDKAHAMRHYQPESESDHEQARLQGRTQGHASAAGREEESHAAAEGTEGSGEAGAGASA